MYATDIAEIFKSLYSDYQNFGAVNLLSETIVLLASRASMGSRAYASQAAVLEARAQEMLDRNSVNRMNASTRKMLVESVFGPTLPDRLASFVIHSLPKDPTRAPPSSEVDYFLSLLTKNMSKISTFIDITHDLPLKEFEPKDNELTLIVSLSDRSFDDDLEVMAQVFIEFDRFISVVTASFNKDQEKPKLLYISSGSALATLVCTAVVAQSVISMFSAIVQAANQTVNFLKAANVLKAGGGDVIIGPEQLELAGSKFLEQAMNLQFNILNAEIAKNMEPDTKVKILMTSSILVERVREGCKITLGNVAERQIGPITQDDEEKSSILKSLIEKSRSLDLKIDEIFGNTDPVPQITGPEDTASSIEV